MSSGSHPPVVVWTAVTAPSGRGRTGTTGCRSGRSPPAPVEAHPGQQTVVVDGERLPAA